MRSNRAAIVVLILLAAAGVWGAYALLQMRLAEGDVYPAYSSLRADPLGTRALHDALAEIPGTAVRRNHEPLYRLAEMTNSTLFVLGAEPGELLTMDIGSFDAIQSVVLSGGRLVLSFAPVNEAPKSSWHARRSQEDDKQKADKAEARRRARGTAGDRRTTSTDDATSATDHHTTTGRASDLPTTVSVRERWGVRPDYVALSRDDDDRFRTETAYPTKESGLVSEVAWHTALVFDTSHPAWRTILKRAGKPVMVERAIGRGSVVLCADSYFLSNQALRDSRNPELLAWLLGGNRRVVFEETVHGIGVQPGVMGFVRHFRLHGLLAGVLAVMALFVWQNATSLVPPFEDSAGGAKAVAGRDMAAGFVNLLRRNIPPKDLMRACTVEWRRSAGAQADPATLEKVKRIVDDEEQRKPRHRDPLAAYHRISEILDKRRGK